MNLGTIILQVLFTLPLTLLIGYLQKKEYTSLHIIIVPTIYILLLSAIIPSIKTNIFLIVIFEIFIRNFYITNITNQMRKSSNFVFLIETISSIVFSIFTYFYYIEKVENVFPSANEVKPFLWFIIIVYIYKLYNNNIQENKEKIKKENRYYKDENIVMQYAKFKNKYSNLIKTKNKTINNVIYSIMIFENNNSPYIYRKVNEIKANFTTKETKYGIMQYPSKVKVTDEESISLTIEKIEATIKKEKITNSDKIVERTLLNYNEEQKEQIKKIYDCIVDFTNK